MSLLGKSIGNYRIKAKLGEGGMGVVYLGEHPLIGKRVAVKVLLEELAANEEIVNRFFNEAKSVNEIGHQNIVDIVDFGKVRNERGGDIVYFIMEFLEGESMATRIRRTGLTARETLHVVTQCCSALAASHQKGIVHRDLKPENIYLCARGSDQNFVKLLDFGIAKLTGQGAGTSSTSNRTRTGLVIGTPAYMSPEQCEGKGLVDHRSDIYSLGVVMYELLTGRVPFAGTGFGEILVAHLTRMPEKPSTLNPDIIPEVEAIVLHAIEKDRERRFQTMEEFGAAIADPVRHYQQYHPPGAPVGKHSGGTILLDDRALPPVHVAGEPRPTTLSGAAAELGNKAARNRVPFVLAAILSVVLCGSGIGWLVWHSGKQVPVPAVYKPLRITVASSPSGVAVYRPDRRGLIGNTPLDLVVTPGEPSFDIQLRADGYQPETRTVTTEREREIDIVLSKVVTPPPPPDRPNITVPVGVHPPERRKVVRPVTPAKKNGDKPPPPAPPPGDFDLLKPEFEK